MREKLIELLYDAMFFEGYGRELCEQQADHLIANGVTIATDNNVGHKWIPAMERLPEENVRVLVCFRFTDYSQNEMDTDRIEKGRWYRWSKYVTHWTPLPDPPKGE